MIMGDENKDDQPDREEPKRERPVPLDYRQRGIDPYQTKTPLGWQVFAGFAAWLCGLGFVVEAANNRTWGGPFVDRQNAAFSAIAVALVGVGALAIWLRLRFRWRGFLPGLLIGFGLTCLVPVGILLVICGTGGFRP
jgi:hypothetical protein